MLTLAPKAPPQTQSGPPAGEMLARGLANHQSGDRVEAEASYREVLRLDPNHADAQHLLGVVAQQNGDYVEAERLIRSAIARNPRAANYHNNSGNTERRQGDLSRAIARYRQPIEIRPKHTDALHSPAHPLAD